MKTDTKTQYVVVYYDITTAKKITLQLVGAYTLYRVLTVLGEMQTYVIEVLLRQDYDFEQKALAASQNEKQN